MTYVEHKSTSSNKFYTFSISDANKAVACTCGDYSHRGQSTGKACKHIVSHEENRKANLRMMEAGY